MDKGIFKKVVTADQLDGMFKLNASFLGEHGNNIIKERDIRRVDGSELKDLTYLTSSCRNGFISKNFFTYSDAATPLVGIAVSEGASDNIVPFTEPVFTQLQFIDERTWLVRVRSGELHMIVDSSLSEGFVDVDLLALKPNLFFYQLDFASGERGLACSDTYLFKGGLFIPKTADEFLEWYRGKIIKYGSEGALDENAVSTLFKVKDEVLRSIFNTSRYHVLSFDQSRVYNV